MDGWGQGKRARELQGLRQKNAQVCTLQFYMTYFTFKRLHIMFCRYVPILGWAWGLSDTIFLERNWEKDEVRFDLIKIIRLVFICR